MIAQLTEKYTKGRVRFVPAFLVAALAQQGLSMRKQSKEYERLMGPYVPDTVNSNGKVLKKSKFPYPTGLIEEYIRTGGEGVHEETVDQWMPSPQFTAAQRKYFVDHFIPIKYLGNPNMNKMNAIEKVLGNSKYPMQRTVLMRRLSAYDLLQSRDAHKLIDTALNTKTFPLTPKGNQKWAQAYVQGKIDSLT